MEVAIWGGGGLVALAPLVFLFQLLPLVSAVGMPRAFLFSLFLIAARVFGSRSSIVELLVLKLYNGFLNFSVL